MTKSPSDRSPQEGDVYCPRLLKGGGNDIRKHVANLVLLIDHIMDGRPVPAEFTDTKEKMLSLQNLLCAINFSFNATNGLDYSIAATVINEDTEVCYVVNVPESDCKISEEGLFSWICGNSQETMNVLQDSASKCAFAKVEKMIEAGEDVPEAVRELYRAEVERNAGEAVGSA